MLPSENLSPSQINDEWVKRILINQANIERTFLAENRKLADETLMRQPRGGVAWSADNMRVQRFPYVRSPNNMSFTILIFMIASLVKEVVPPPDLTASKPTTRETCSSPVEIQPRRNGKCN